MHYDITAERRQLHVFDGRMWDTRIAKNGVVRYVANTQSSINTVNGIYWDLANITCWSWLTLILYNLGKNIDSNIWK